MCKSRGFARHRGSWQLKRDFDAFGNVLETELGAVYTSIAALSEETALLPQHFQSDGYYGTPTPEQEALPGYIPDITDFTSIVCFGIAGGGEQFCFDFRDTRDSPSVVYWDDNYWRRIAPDFHAFVELFDFATGV